MKKLIMVVMTLVMLTAVMGMTAITANAATANLIPGTAGTFEDTAIPSKWSALYGKGTISIASDESHGGSKSLMIAGRTSSWHSPSYMINDILKANGAGTYNISLWVMADGVTSGNNCELKLRCGNATYSFITDAPNKIGLLGKAELKNGTWTQVSGTVTVTATDIGGVDDINLCLDSVVATVTDFYIDDVTITKADGTSATTAPTTAPGATNAPTATKKPGSVESTGDFASLGYAITAFVGLGGLAVGRRRFTK